jgi:hypothetical protein
MNFVGNYRRIVNSVDSMYRALVNQDVPVNKKLDNKGITSLLLRGRKGIILTKDN